MKNEIEPKNTFFSKSHEAEIIENLTQRQFYEWMESNGFTIKRLRDIFDSKKLSTTEQCQFNYALRKIKEELHIDIMTSVLYLEQFFTKLKKVLSVIDEETKQIMIIELSKKYKIELDETIMEELLE